MNPNAYTRREFLSSGLILASASIAVPSFIQASAIAMTRALNGLSSAPGVPDEHILVVVQLAGGNDGLNTVIPYGMPEYYKARPGIGVKDTEALKLSGADGIGLHAQMAPMKEMYDDGMCAIIQGVGYPNPNRSHFKSTAIWHTGDTNATGDGWLGRYFDAECCGYGKGESGKAEKPAHLDTSGGPPGLVIGRSAPLAMQGRQVSPVAFESAELFRWTGQDVQKGLAEPYDTINRRGSSPDAKPGTNADFLLKTALDAQVSSDLIRKAVAQRSQVAYPNSDLARQLSMVGSMIRANMKTRVYYVTVGGFDTHAGQGGAQGRHGQLLNQVSAAIKAFYQDLKQQGNDGRVLTMAFSEFGRRVTQNASQGTDHGTAAPSFLFGPMVKAGVHGDHPSLHDLDEGDLKYKVDFRSVYATVLEGWMKADSKTILENKYATLPLLKKVIDGATGIR